MAATLKDKRILVVGGSSGLGLSVAKLASSLGAEVLVASRSAVSRNEELCNIIGTKTSIFSFDINSESETVDLMANIKTFDHLVVAVRPDIVSEAFVSSNIFSAKKAFDTKFWGQYQLIQSSLKHLSKSGSIVMTSGIAGSKIYPNASTMTIINSATEALCKSLAVEISPARINVVSPGFIEPKPEETISYSQKFPAGRLATSNEVAEAYIYLMTNDYITGSVLTVDGGARLI